MKTIIIGIIFIVFEIYLLRKVLVWPAMASESKFFAIYCFYIVPILAGLASLVLYFWNPHMFPKYFRIFTVIGVLLFDALAFFCQASKTLKFLSYIFVLASAACMTAFWLA